MSDLANGFTIQTRGYKTVTVIEKIGEGGQGAVYKVDYNGEPAALKWYTGKKLKNPDKFYANLESNIKHGAPTRAFLWPRDITERLGGAFGYIMDLRPAEYRDFTKFLLAKERFASCNAWVNTALNITAGFRELHNKGFSYQDLNDGNFFIDPRNGEVLICDNDNVAEYGTNLGIAGKARYMAPEIVLGKSMPDNMSDRFSLSVVLFLLFTFSHPLEGKKTCVPCMTEEFEKRFYGEEPVFIFDPNDHTNVPVPNIHKNAIKGWQSLPEYLKEKFVTAFSGEVMSDPNRRIIEKTWLQILIRMKSEIYKCPCGEVYFADPQMPNPCPACGKKNTFSVYIKLPRYNVAVHQRTKLFACHTEKDGEDFKDGLKTVTAESVVKDGQFALKNVSGKPWTVLENETQTVVDPDGLCVLKKGVTVNFGGVSAQIL
jgi:serine/threonine protein kinase